jgi:trehalose synthase
MVRRIETKRTAALDDHEAVAQLAQAVRDLRMEGERVARCLEGRTVWMISSTERGGGVAEMMPAMITLLRELGIAVEWLVLEAAEPRFFEITKQVHNLLHGEGDPHLDAEARGIYERVNAANARGAAERMNDGDIVVVHDPQPMPLAGMLREQRDIIPIWRCHIGLDAVTDQTRAGWRFLEPYAGAYCSGIFSAPEYIPDYFASRAHVIHPAIDPLTDKNRHLGLHHTVEILVRSGLIVPPGPIVHEPWEHAAQRLDPDGEWAPATKAGDIGLLTRPIVTQVSRWDRLKGFLPLMHGFAEMKRRVLADPSFRNGERARRLRLVRLVLAGPDPASIADDPEGGDVLDSLCRAYVALEPELQSEIALISLPMHSASQNALMVNVLHRVSTIVAQNSLREGFGLTITEAMWKRVPILSNRQACGPRYQVRDHLDGRLIDDPEDTAQIAVTLNEMLCAPDELEAYARTAQHHVHERFLIFTQLRHWLERFAAVV